MTQTNKTPKDQKAVTEIARFLRSMSAYAIQKKAPELPCFVIALANQEGGKNLATPFVNTQQFKEKAPLLASILEKDDSYSWVAAVYPAFMSKFPILTADGKIVRPSEMDYKDRIQVYVANCTNKNGQRMMLYFERVGASCKLKDGEPTVQWQGDDWEIQGADWAQTAPTNETRH